ncbi:MAG: riboflavin synthase [Planctomycetales bacterium]|nr:riboflavin synthase [Planctomycetales bacterium]
MFAGLVEELGTVAALVDQPPGMRLEVTSQLVHEGAKIGDSIAINGCCLTVIAIDGNRLAFEAGPETLKRTNLGQLQVGDGINLERSLIIGDRLGGHFVTGHIDGLGDVISREDDREWSTFWFRCGKELAQQMAGKGSVAVDGVSLTLVDVADDRFSVALIPHTLKVTTLGRKQIGQQVNLETDLLAKYVSRQLQFSPTT